MNRGRGGGLRHMQKPDGERFPSRLHARVRGALPPAFAHVLHERLFCVRRGIIYVKSRTSRPCWYMRGYEPSIKRVFCRGCGIFRYPVVGCFHQCPRRSGVVTVSACVNVRVWYIDHVVCGEKYFILFLFFIFPYSPAGVLCERGVNR
ncbi:unnamed protein product [Ectocarpus sp. 6 AP-2014]